MEGKVVFEGKTDKGFPIVIRYPKISDLDQALKYINELSKEQTFILYQGEITSEADEKMARNPDQKN